MKKLSKSLLLLALGTTAVCGLGFAVKTSSKEVVPTFATYTNHDAATYYSGISDSLDGTSLLSALQSLNSSKRKTTVGYSNMGTTPSGQFKYTDYDPNSIQYDSNGQPYGTKLTTFYSGNSATNGMNREHVWPDSHGGNTVESDIHMPRPALEKENGSRGNSFYVEGKKDPSSGWDPAMESFGLESYRGDSARIILYCVVANPNLNLLEADSHSTSKSNRDYLMGRLSTLLDWNIRYPVLEREQNRNEGAEYLQGNRNPFIDHPEYACKIWGNSNSATKAVCAKAKTVTSLTATGTLQQTKFYDGDSFNPTGLTITATYSDDSTANVTSSVVWPNLTTGQTSVTGTYGGCNVTISGINVIDSPSNVEDVSLNLNSATIHINGFVQLTPTISPKTAKNKNVTWSTSNSSVATVSSSGLVVGVSEGTATITVKTEDGNFTDTCVVTVSGVQEDVTVEITRESFDSGSGYAWNNWSQDDISGQAYIFLGTTGKMQFNKSKSGYAIFTHTTNGSIKSVTVKSQTGSPKWTLYTSSTPYNSNTTTSGNSQGQKAVTTSGVKWDVSNGDAYFSLSLDDSGAQYLSSIKVEYSNSVPPTPTPKVNSITLPSTLTINLSDDSTGTLVPVVNADEGASYTIEWDSSDPSVATVSGNNTSATVTALKTGTTTITASAGGKSGTCVVTVTENVVPPTPDPKVNSIELLPESLTINLSSPHDTTITPVVDADSGASYTIVWSSSDESVATVSGNNSSATIQAKDVGTTNITASIANLSATCEVTVVQSVVPPTPDPKVTSILLPANLTIDLNDTSTGTIVPIVDADEGATYTISWSSSNISVATVSGNNSSATVTGLGEGTSIITATIGELSASCEVTVIPLDRIVEIEVGGNFKTDYKVGETFNPTDLVVTAHHLNGTDEDVTDAATIGDVDTSTVGEKTVEVTYLTFKTSFSITVLDKSVNRLILKKTPAKVQYFADEPFNPYGAVIQAVLEDESIIDNVVDQCNFEYNFEESNVVRYSFGGKSSVFAVVILTGEPTVEHKAADFAYTFNEKLDDVEAKDVTLEQWDSLKYDYNKLDDDSKAYLKTITITSGEGEVSAEIPNEEALKQFAAKYDAIYLSHKGEEGFIDFIGRNPTNPVGPVNPTPDKPNYTLIIIIVAACVVVIALVAIIVPVSVHKSRQKEVNKNA